MRGSVVFIAVFAVTSCSVGVNGASFVRSGITGYGTGRGSEDAPGVEESAFGNGKSDGHRIGKRSNLGHDIAEQAGFRSTAAGRRQMMDPNALFPKPVLAPPIVEVPQPGLTGPILTPPLSTRSRNYPSLVEPHHLPLRRAMPSVLEREVRPFPAPEVKDEGMEIISNALPDPHILSAILPIPSARRSFARSQYIYRSDLENRRSGYSGLRSYSPPRSYPPLPGPLTDDGVAVPLYKHVRNTAPAQRGNEENFRMEVRSAVINYLVQLWEKLSKWFKPGSSSGGGMGGLPPKGEIPIAGGKEAEPGLPGESPPEESFDEVITEPVTPPVDDGVEVIHPSSGEDASEAAKDSTAEGGSDVDEVYYEPIHPKPEYQSNWEARSALGKEDDLDIITDIFGRLADD